MNRDWEDQLDAIKFAGPQEIDYEAKEELENQLIDEVYDRDR